MNASACTDQTEEVVNHLIGEDSRIKLISDSIREGKSAAINKIVRNAKFEIIALVDADIIITPESLLKLVEPFKNNNVGIVSGRWITTTSESFTSQFGILQTDLQHGINLSCHQNHQDIKIHGSFYAFRRDLFSNIPKTVISDDEYIHSEIYKKGYKSYYAREAIFLKKEPTRLSNYIKTRIRVLIGHYDLAKNFKFKTATINPMNNIATLKTMLLNSSLRKLISVPIFIVLEILIRIIAYIDYRLGHLPFIYRGEEETKIL